jgi:hypothetical protein
MDHRRLPRVCPCAAMQLENREAHSEIKTESPLIKGSFHSAFFLFISFAYSAVPAISWTKTNPFFQLLANAIQYSHSQALAFIFWTFDAPYRMLVW